MLPNPIPHSKNKIHQKLPDLPEDEWCDLRREYEKGKTLKHLASEYICDPRTVRRCLMLNKNISDIGKQTAPKKLNAYLSRIDQLYADFSKEYIGICSISSHITKQLIIEGYTGSERTVRNYLSSRFYSVSTTGRKEPHYDHH